MVSFGRGGKLRLDSKAGDIAICGLETRCDSSNSFRHNGDEATSWDYIAHTGIFCVLRLFRLF
jgi:hypothetical protein